MDMQPAPAHPPTSAGTHWATITGIVVTLLTATVVVVGMVLARFADGLTQHGNLKDHSGSAVEPLRPGATAHYDDGLTITVSRPQRQPDGSYRLTVTYDNGTGKELRPGGASPDTGVGSSGGSAPLVVRAGKAFDSGLPSPSSSSSASSSVGAGPLPDVTVLDRTELVTAPMPPLGGDQKRTVPVHFKPGTGMGPVTVEVAPSSPGYREHAYWQFDLG
ncbi:hypothetical protein ABTZ03_09430 [Kitasatospora sp. NPDC096077]|uniref:hypothetical protein n=1 Tax=Kitasatospora sp. NPDC096077 TaxID=3155544 RepID=UPI00332C377B